MAKRHNDIKAYSATTAETFADMVDAIENYDADNVYGIPRERLQNELDICRNIADTLTKRDLLMIYHMRNVGIGKRFADVAKQLYDARQALANLTDPE